MRRMNRSWPVLAWSAMCVLLLSACQPATKEADPAADDAAVRKVLEEIVTTFNAGDYEAMFAHYEDDVLVQSSAAPEITSKQAWRDTLKNTLPPDVKLQMSFETVELVIDGDLAYERGKFTIGMPGDAALPPLFAGRHIHMFRRGADGAWKGWRLFEIVDQMPPGFVPPGGAPSQPQ